MYTRVLTYDLKSARTDNYRELYDYLDSVNAKKLTESSYLINTNQAWDAFKKKIISITRPGDNVKAIVKHDGLDVWIIR